MAEEKAKAIAAAADATKTLSAIAEREVKEKAEELAYHLPTKTCYKIYAFQPTGHGVAYSSQQGCFTDHREAKRVATLNSAKVIEKYITFEELLEFVRRGEVNENPFADYSGY